MGYKNITFKVVKDIYWDDWGVFRRVFKKDDVCTGKQYLDGVVCAESPYYEGVSDIVDLESIEIQ